MEVGWGGGSASDVPQPKSNKHHMSMRTPWIGHCCRAEPHFARYVFGR